MKLRWLPHARADLRAIRAHVAEDSPINAERLLEKLIRRAERIPDFPRAGRVVPELALDDDRIDVLTVMHGARLLRQIPRR
jgi:plasmid stabilization system protein ParE